MVKRLKQRTIARKPRNEIETTIPPRRYAKANSPVSVLLYLGPGAADVDGFPLEITGFCKRISWTNSITAPYGGANLTLEMPVGHLLDFVNPTMGMWVEIRSNDNVHKALVESGIPLKPDQQAVTPGTQQRFFVGEVVKIDTSYVVDQNTGHRKAILSVDCENWFYTLSRVNVWVSAGMTSSTPFQFRRNKHTGATEFYHNIRITGGNQWKAKVKSAPLQIRTGTMFDIGDWMELQPKYLSSQPGEQLDKMFNHVAISKVGSRLGNRLNSFAEVEGGSRASDRVADAVIGMNWRGVQSILPVHGNAALDIISGSVAADPMMVELFPYIDSSNNAKLLYRMKPWRTMPLQEYATRVDSTAFPIDANMWSRPTWNLMNERKATIPKEDVIAFRSSRNMDAAINAVTTKMAVACDTSIMFNLNYGLPYFNILTVESMGARTYCVDWPFIDIRRQQDNDPKSDFFTYVRTIAVQGYHFLVNGHRFITGSATVAFNLSVKHGSRVKFSGVPIGRLAYLGTEATDVAAQSKLHKEFQSVEAYVNSVTHNINIGQSGEVSAQTTIEYSRGLPEQLEGYRTSYGQELLW